MYESYLVLLKQRLKPHRFVHSLNVAESAKDLAKKWGGDEDKAYLAGLLHDICKNDSDENLLQMFSEFGIILDSVTASSPKLWHAVAGALYVERVLDISDKEIIDAIACHTTAKSNMTLLDEILYLADFISAERDYDGVDTMRALVEKDKNEAMKEALRFTITDLCGQQKPIHPDTFSAYNERMSK